MASEISYENSTRIQGAWERPVQRDNLISAGKQLSRCSGRSQGPVDKRPLVAPLHRILIRR